MLQRLGIAVDKFGSSTGTLTGLKAASCSLEMNHGRCDDGNRNL